MAARQVSDARLERTVVEILGHRVLSTAEICDELERQGVEFGDDEHRVEFTLEQIGAFPLGDDHWVQIDRLLDGVTWTVSITERDVERSQLREDPDLTLLGWVALVQPLDTEHEQSAVRSSGIHELGVEVLVGPEGWLSHVEAGAGEVAVRLDGRLLTVLPAGDVPSLPVEPIRAALLEAYGEQRLAIDSVPVGGGDVDVESADIAPVLASALARHPSAFAGGRVPLFDELLAETGLHRLGHVLAPATQPWELLERAHRRGSLRRGHGLSAGEVDATEAVLTAIDTYEAGDDPFGDDAALAPGELAALLGDDVIGNAVVGHHMSEGAEWDTIAAFAELVLEHVDGDRHRVGPLWLLGRALDLAGEPHAAEEAFADAVATGQEQRHALHGLATFLADRGDAVGAMGLLRRAGGTPEDSDQVGELATEIVGYATHRPRPAVGRNEPCPCGSGRKYKACHAGREQHGLIDRGPWLYEKAMRFVRDHDYRLTVVDVAGAVSDSSGGVFRFLELRDSPLVFDLVLHEGGVFEEFLEHRSHVLPDDEALTASAWSFTDRALWEVERVGRDWLALRDVRTGDRVEVTNTNPDEATKPGRLFLGRPLPIAGTYRAYSGLVPVPLSMRDSVLDALDDVDEIGIEATEMARLIGGLVHMPTLTNTDGDPLDFHELTYEVPDPTVATEAFEAAEAAGRLNQEREGRYVVRRATDTEGTLLVASIAVYGRMVTVTANSAARAESASELIAELVPGAKLVDHDHRTIDEMVRLRNEAGNVESPPELDDPAAAELLQRFVAEREERWLDEHVPALGGRTPREAATDPIGREELRQLLAQFDRFEDQPGAMSPRRLRGLLGLDDC